MAIKIYKTYTFVAVLFAVAVIGCGSNSKAREPEVMYDMASQLKDIALAVQGTVKYDDGERMSDKELLLAALGNDKSSLEIFGEYQLHVLVEGKRSSLMLCDDEVALIEDSGCTAEVDAHYWNANKPYSCEFKLELAKVCN